MQNMFEIFKTNDVNQALRRAIVCYGTDAKITLDMVKELIEKADINSQDNNPKSRQTPLHLALKHNRFQIMLQLYAKKARVDIEDAQGKTVLEYAIQSSDVAIRIGFLSFFLKGLTEKVRSVFQCISEAEQSKKENRDLNRQFQETMANHTNEKLNVMAYIFVLLTVVEGDYPNENAEFQHLTAKTHIKARLENLIVFDAFKKTFQNSTLRFNFNVNVTYRFMWELLKNKEIQQELIPFQVVCKFHEVGNELFIIVNGSLAENEENHVINDDTYLCNASEETPALRVQMGPVIRVYIGKRRLGLFQNFTKINTQHLMYSKDEFTRVLKGVQQAVYKEVQNEQTYEGNLDKFLKETFMRLYESSLKNGVIEKVKVHPRNKQAKFDLEMAKLYAELQKQINSSCKVTTVVGFSAASASAASASITTTTSTSVTAASSPSHTSSIESSSVESWTDQELAQWVAKLGSEYSSYTDAIIKNGIDGSSVMAPQKLSSAVPNAQHCKNILENLAQYNAKINKKNKLKK